jgi:tetratricopeptide (TPR) repeat protein
MEELENSVECLRAQVEPLRTFFDAKIGSGFVTTVRKAAISWEIQKHEHQHELAAETTKGSSLGTEQNATSRLAIQSRPNPSALQLQVPPSHGVEEVGVRTHSVANTEPVPAGLRLKFVPEEISEENVPHPFVPSISHLHANRPPDITDGQCSTEIMGKEPNTANQIMRGESLPTEPEFTAMRDILPYVRGDETEQHSELDSKRFDPREFIRSDKGLGKERSSEPPDTTSKLLDWCFYRFFDYPKYDYLTQVLDRGNPPGSDDSISEVMFSRGEPTMSEAAKSTGEVDSVFERFPMEVGIFATTEDNPGRAALLKTPRDIIFSRFKRTLNMDDLKVAISNIELAVSATPEDDPDRVVMLNNLGNQLFCRFELTGNIDDLEAAISNLKQAISIIPKYHPARAAMLNDFGGILLRQYNRTGDINDLEAAISNVELALSITPKDDPDQAAMLNNFGNMLFCRYKKTGNINDLRTAISNAELAVSATPQNHPNREGRLTSLRNMLGSS